MIIWTYPKTYHRASSYHGKMRSGNRRSTMNTSHFVADIVMNTDTSTGIASRSSELPLNILEGVEEMSMALKKWELGKERPGNNLPRKTPIGPKPRINLKSLTRSTRKGKEVEAKKKKQIEQSAEKENNASAEQKEMELSST